jgi:hypothetical protein
MLAADYVFCYCFAPDTFVEIKSQPQKLSIPPLLPCRNYLMRGIGV